MIRSCIRQAVRAFAGAALIAFAMTAQAANLTISASNCASYSVGAPDSSGNITITCVAANGTGPLTGCTIQGSNAGTVGTALALTAVCSGGAPATNWAWSGGSCEGNLTQSCQANEAAATVQTYSVVIHNGAGADATPIRQVTWSAAGGGGGGGGGPISCSGYLNTNVYTAAWPSTINGSVPMGPLDAGVVKFTTGSGTGNGQISMTNAPNASVTTTHDYVLSATPCDFTGLKKFVGAGAPTIRFNISGSLGVNLLPNTTYYINIRNNDTTGCAVNGGSCDIWPVNLTGPK